MGGKDLDHNSSQGKNKIPFACFSEQDSRWFYLRGFGMNSCLKRFLFLIIAFSGTALVLVADPVVDGKIDSGEYAHSRKLMSDKLVLSWQSGPDGGLFVAVSAKTKGWVAVGLGSARMEGSTIYISSIGADGTPVFSEDAGKGHGHAPSSRKTADQSAVGLEGEWTTVEIHIPAESLPFTGEINGLHLRLCGLEKPRQLARPFQSRQRHPGSPVAEPHHPPQFKLAP